MAADSNRLLRKEVESLNSRLRKFNQENDDLLQRLSDLKFEKERREEEFEQEKLILRTRLRDVERDKLDLGHQLDSVRRELDQKGPTKQQASREDHEVSRRQIESLRQEHVRRERELLERLNSLRMERETKERGWKKEVDQLKATVQSQLKTMDEMRLENDRLMMARTLPLDEERRLRQEVTEMKRTREADAKDLKDALRENDELRKDLDGRNEGMRRRMDELNDALRLKERELDEAKREIVRLENNRNADLSSKERETSLRREIDRLNGMVEAKQGLLEKATKDQVRLRRIAADVQLNDDSKDRKTRLEHEVDRLNAMLTLKERQLLDTTNDRLRLQEELVSLKGMDIEGQPLKKEVDRLTVSVRSKEVLLEDSLAKNRELSAANEQLERDLRETRSFLKSTSDTNQDLVDKNLKLERALAKTKADSEHTPAAEKVSPYLRTLLKEQESHIEDLQRQVGTIKTTIMDNAKTKQQLAILAAAAVAVPEIEPDHRDTNQGGDGILRELKQARRNLDFSQSRISQLENWLDEIYTSTGVIAGGGVGSVGRPMATRRQRPSGSRSVLAAAASKRTALRGVLALPEIADLDENTIERNYSTMPRSNRRINTNRISRPSWNITTSTS